MSLVLVGVLACACHGATGAGEIGNSELPSYHFTVFAAETLTGLGYVPEPDAEPIPLRFLPTERSARYEYRGQSPFRLIDLTTGEVVGAVEIPPQPGELLFLVLSRDREQYSIQVIDDSPRAGGELRILNLSGLGLSGAINGRAIPIGEGMNASIRIAGTVQLELRTEFRGRSYRALTETLETGPGRPNLLILFPPYRPGSLEVQWRLI